MNKEELNFFKKVRIYAVPDALEWRDLKASVISAIEEDASGVHNVRYDSISGANHGNNTHEKRIIDMSERIERIEQLSLSQKAEETIRWYKKQLYNLPCETWLKVLIDRIWKEKGRGTNKRIVMDNSILEQTAKERGIGVTKLRDMLAEVLEKTDMDLDGYDGLIPSEKEAIYRSTVFEEYREMYGIPEK